MLTNVKIVEPPTPLRSNYQSENEYNSRLFDFLCNVNNNIRDVCDTIRSIDEHIGHIYGRLAELEEPVPGVPIEPVETEPEQNAAETEQNAAETEQGAAEPEQGAAEPEQGAAEPEQEAADDTAPITEMTENEEE